MLHYCVYVLFTRDVNCPIDIRTLYHTQQLVYSVTSGQVRSGQCLTCTFRASCCSARLSRDRNGYVKFRNTLILPTSLSNEQCTLLFSINARLNTTRRISNKHVLIGLISKIMLRLCVTSHNRGSIVFNCGCNRWSDRCCSVMVALHQIK